MQFPTGGKVRERKLNRCDSGTDSTVWMKEDASGYIGRLLWHLESLSRCNFFIVR